MLKYDFCLDYTSYLHHGNHCDVVNGTAADNSDVLSIMNCVPCDFCYYYSEKLKQSVYSTNLISGDFSSKIIFKFFILSRYDGKSALGQTYC